MDESASEGVKERKMKALKKRKPKKAVQEDDTRPLSPSEPTERRNTSVDSILRAALEDTQRTSKTKKGKKKRKNENNVPNDTTVLESLRQSAELVKNGDDSVLLANTYNEQDSPRFSKNETNARGRKLPPKKGNENLGFVVDDEEGDVPSDIDDERHTRRTRKNKKKTPATSIEEQEETKGSFTLSELVGASQQKPKKKKKKVIREHDDSLDEENMTERAADREEPEEALRKKKKKRKKAAPATDDDEAAALADDGRILCITIHRSDRLKTDLYVKHPLARVHVVDMNTGAAVKKSTRDRPVTSFFENRNENVDFILPVLTQPFDFKQRKSLIPTWEEQLLFNESYLYMTSTKETAPRVIFFFEILDFVSMNVVNMHPKLLKGDGAWHRIAWGFLKLIGANGELNTDKKARLQLFHPPFAFKAKPDQLDVYQWWLHTRRQPYPSTLYVTVKPIHPPDHIEPSSRSLYPIQQEEGLMTYKELKNTMELGLKSANTPRRQSVPASWSRLPGQMCRIPNKPTLSLAGDKKGCYVVRFSPDGSSIACGCREKDGYPIVIYEIPAGMFKMKFAGHFGIIYDLVWSAGGGHLLTASSDGTARLWNLDTPEGPAEKVFPHPAFVYCGRFHPKADDFIATGGYDHLVRVWSRQSNTQHGELYQELEGHRGFVNCLVFAKDGLSMYSGDSNGTIIVWNCIVNKDLEEWSKSRVVQHEELENVSINSLVVHPSGRRLLIHGRDNNIRMMDLRLFNIMQRYVGALNFREHIRSTLSACGTFVFSGSEDGQAYVWNTDTGDQMASYTTLGYQYPVSDVVYHPQEHMVAFCSRGEGHPVQVFIYDSKYPQLNYLSRGLLAEAADQTAKINQEASQSLTAAMESRRLISDEIAQQKSEWLERVKARLATVMSLTPEPSPQRTARMGTFASTYDTWGSTFDRTQFTTQGGSPGTGGLRSGFRQTSGFSRTGTPTIGLKTGPAGKAVFTFNPDVSAAPKNPAEYRRVRALYDYTAQRSDELNLLEGDVIMVLHEDNENWWMGELNNGYQGYFPSNYVEGISVGNPSLQNGVTTPAMDEVDSAQPSALTASRRKNRDSTRNSTKDSSHFSAFRTSDGDLRIVSGTEDSEAETLTTKRRRPKPQTVPQSPGGSSGAGRDGTVRKAGSRVKKQSTGSPSSDMPLDRRRKTKKNHAERDV